MPWEVVLADIGYQVTGVAEPWLTVDTGNGVMLFRVSEESEQTIATVRSTHAWPAGDDFKDWSIEDIQNWIHSYSGAECIGVPGAMHLQVTIQWPRRSDAMDEIYEPFRRLRALRQRLIEAIATEYDERGKEMSGVDIALKAIRTAVGSIPKADW